MTTIKAGDPLWLECPAPGRCRETTGGFAGKGYDPWISDYDGKVWVIDHATAGGQQVPMTNRVNRWSVRDGQIEVTVSGGKTIKATETGESDAAHGRVSGRVTEDAII